ncbi:MAG: hypothetical protein JO101_11905 [Candidatus Eremiobacteraeota bacterium]|nr:hypothetical protein [Candidatus Eremiobacteraeota bacterium]MBV8356019.1 hypothetical protein [Candidatus Eremiobacteraeota bacterium]
MKFYDFVDKAPKIAALVVVDGSDLLLAERAVAAVVEQLLPGAERDLNLDVFSAEGLEPRKVADAVQAMPFLAERRVAVVRGAGALRAAERRALWEVAKSVPDGNTLVIEELTGGPGPPRRGTKPESFASLAGRSALRIEVNANAEVRARFIDETLRDLGAKAERRVVATLAASEADLLAVRTDLEKLAIGGGTITFAQLENETLATVDPKAWQYAGALVAGRVPEALAIAQELFERDSRAAAAPLLGALASEYDVVWQLARGVELEPRNAWRAGRLGPIARRLGERRARRGFDLAVRGFEAIVTGRGEDPRAVVELVTAVAATL